MWLVMLAKKGEWMVHSVHAYEVKARSWAECKDHDGEDSAVAVIPSDVMEQIERYIEKINTQQR